MLLRIRLTTAEHTWRSLRCSDARCVHPDHAPDRATPASRRVARIMFTRAFCAMSFPDRHSPTISSSLALLVLSALALTLLALLAALVNTSNATLRAPLFRDLHTMSPLKP